MPPKRFPFDKTCCARYPARLDLSLWISLGMWLFGPVVWLLRLHEKENGTLAGLVRTVLPFLPEAQYDKPLTIFGVAIWLCRVADRTGEHCSYAETLIEHWVDLWLKAQKQFDPWGFAALTILAIIACMVTVKKGSKDMGILNREQTDEWKGWMQSLSTGLNS